MTEYTCIELQPNDPRTCAQDCTGNIDCDLGFHCCGLVNVPKNICVPENYDNGNCMQ